MGASPRMSPLDVVIVCTANRFRSVVVAHVLREVWRGHAVRVRSYASAGQPGRRAIPTAVQAVAERGRNIGGHESTVLTDGVLSDADLVVVFERAHVAPCLDAGAHAGRLYLISELLEILPPSRGLGRSAEEARSLLAGLAQHRLGVSPKAAEYPDPMRLPGRLHPSAVNELWTLAERLGARVLDLPEPSPEAERRQDRRRRLFRR